MTEVLDTDAPLRPDSLYGVTKCFGESLSRYYFDRFGLETVCLRIGSSFEQPKNPRMLVTYLSYRDFIELVRCSLFTNRVGHAIVYGVSDNRTKWVDNTKAAFLGFRPQDNSVQFEHLFPVTAPTADLDDPTQRFQGGPIRAGRADGAEAMSAAGNPRVERVERVEAAGPVPAAVGESPVWRAAEQALYWVDIPAQKIVRLRLESGERSEWLLPEKVACIAFDRRGNVLAGCETGLFAVTLSDASAPLATQAEPVKVSGRKLAAPVFPFGDMRFNDGRCDRQGRFWASTMVQDMAAANPASALYRFDADERAVGAGRGTDSSRRTASAGRPMAARCICRTRTALRRQI